MAKSDNEIKYEGNLDLNGVIINCYILEDGTRVLSGREVQRALSMVDDDDSSKTSGARLSRYLNQKTLKPFIDAAYEPGHFDPIICTKGKQSINGFSAEALIDICDLFLQARRERNLSSRQQIIADQCEMLVRTFAKVGLIALIDEATGYQYEREQSALQVIFKELISDEILSWQQQFHLSFYREIYRLWNIPFTEQNIRRKPLFLGHLTNKYVYSNLPKGTFVLEKLKKKTPKTEKGNYKYRLHQSLTEDKGREALKKVLYTVEALASISKDKREFDKLIQEKYGQKEIPFTDLDQLSLEDAKPKKPTDFDAQLLKALEFNPNEKKS